MTDSTQASGETPQVTPSTTSTKMPSLERTRVMLGDRDIFWQDETPEKGLRTNHVFYLHQNGELIAKMAGTPRPPQEDFIPTGFVVAWLEAGKTEQEIRVWLSNLGMSIEKIDYALEKMSGSFYG